MAHLQEAEVVPQQFPAGVRVLVVDADITVLKSIEQMCIGCNYHVTPCSEATVALNLLREKKGSFDLILIDVHMPDMNGYDFLQHVNKEINLPVIMMSVDDTTSDVMKAITDGACDYWIKPLREEQFKNMWQHVARKALRENRQHEILGGGGHRKRAKDDSELIASTVIDDAITEGGTNNNNNAPRDQSASKGHVVETDDHNNNDDYHQPPAKKPRVVWSAELHQQFVMAVMQLGLEKAVPKRILEVMNVPGLTREHVASHLQKFRLYLKKSSNGETQQQNMGGKQKAKQLGFDFEALAAAATGHNNIPLETTLTGFQADVLAGGKYSPMQQMHWLPNNINNPFHVAAAEQQQQQHSISNAKNIVKSNNMIIPDDSAAVVNNNSNIEKLLLMKNNNNVLRNNTLQDQLHQQQQSSLMHVQINSINVQPPCMVLPGGNSTNNPAFVNNQSWINSPQLQPNHSFSTIAQFPSGGGENNTGIFFGCVPPMTMMTQQQQQLLLPNSTLRTTVGGNALRSDTLVHHNSAGPQVESSPSDVDNMNTTTEGTNSMYSPQDQDHPFS